MEWLNQFPVDLFRYYYLTWKYLLISPIDTHPKPSLSNDIFLFHSWMRIMLFKIWNVPNPELMEQGSMYDILMINFRWKNKSFQKYVGVSYVFQFIYLILIFIWPFLMLLMSVYFRMNYNMYQRTMMDIISFFEFVFHTNNNLSLKDIITRWCLLNEKYALGRHHAIMCSYLWYYYRDNQNFTQLKQQLLFYDKRNMAIALKKNDLPHPYTIICNQDMKILINDMNKKKLIIKPRIGYAGHSYFDANKKIFFVNCDDKNMSNISRYSRSDSEYIVQEIIHNIDELCELWYPSNALGAFRVYTCRDSSTYKLINNTFLRYPDTNVGYTKENGICLGITGEYVEHYFDIHSPKHMYGSKNHQLVGKHFKFMKKIYDLAIKAHKKLLPKYALVAWDIAMSKEYGPIIVEFNVDPGLDLQDLADTECAHDIYQSCFFWM
eukprot:115422_1